MPSDDKLTDKEKEKLSEAFKDAALSDSEVQRLAIGEDESGEVVVPVDGSEELLAAAADALEFVEGLETPDRPSEGIDEDAVEGFDALLAKLENLRSDISSLQRGVVGVFAAQLLTFRGKVVELKSHISEEMVERLKMKFFKSFIETTFVDIVDNEFAALEKDLVDKIVEQTQERFKEFATRVRESEMDLRSTIVEQQDIVRSFMQSLETDAVASRDQLDEKDKEIQKLENEIKALQSSFDATKEARSIQEELSRKVGDLESEIENLKQELLRKDGIIATKSQEADDARKETEEIRIKLGEVETAFEVYRTEKEAIPVSKVSDAEVKALEDKVGLLEKTLEEKRAETDTFQTRIKELESNLSQASKDKETAESESQKRLKELEGIQDKFKEVKDLEEKVYELEQQVKEAEEKVGITEMQREAFEKATRLMEKERDMALEQRDLAQERTKRYIKVLGIEANTKVLLLVDEVGSLSFAELGKSLGIPVGLATKHARELEKLGVLKIKGEKAFSTLKDIEIEEGEVKVD
jgi:chromosome segregation ATPase